jgi:L-ascorbate metabolism protein UlaG (beta-lactamase superfamily)
MQHWSRRIGQEINTTLWASFLLITPTVRVYFGGDTGYFIGYQEFGRKYPGIDYALLPTTAYHPRWFMHYAHMDVDEALEAFRELGARVMIPQQWGTFHLGDEPVGYPAVELERKIAERRLDPARYRIMNLGEILAIPPAPRAGGAPR